MTSETRTMIEPSDFKAIEIECRQCHHRVGRPMGVWRSHLYACPDCGENWSQYTGTMSYLMDMASKNLLKKVPGCDGKLRRVV
jgi:DNA-directed RNA polymerase subunit RPC12/RpoP